MREFIKTKMTPATLVTLVMIGSASLVGAIRDTVSKESVAVAVEAFADAFQSADIEALDQMLTDNYVHTNTGAHPIDKKGWLRWLASRRDEIVRGDYLVETYEIEGLEIVLYGSAAVVTGIVHTSGTSYDKPFDKRIRFTNLWVYQRDRWLRAAFHDAPSR